MGFLALIPFRDWLYGGIILLVGIFAWHTYSKYNAAVRYQQVVVAESKATLDAARKHITDVTADYDKGLKANEAIYENELASADAQHTLDLKRLRAAAAARAADPVLSGTAGASAEAAAWTQRLGTLEPISARLADALRADDAAVAECRRERDALTGK
jgi:hypothetical protein